MKKEADQIVGILAEAKALIEDPIHWCWGTAATNEKGQTRRPRHPEACCWCALGAIEFAARKSRYEPKYWAHWRLDQAAEELGAPEDHKHRPAAWLNDNKGHDAVMRMFDRAIANVKERHPS